MNASLRLITVLALALPACRTTDKDGDGTIDDTGVVTDDSGTDDTGTGTDDSGADDSGTDDADSGVDDPDADEDGYPASEDCDDTDAAVNPGATETCNEVDDDCDGDVDEDTPDTDGDGVCDALDTEECDGLDNDGDGDVDEELLTTYYADADGDGFPDASSSVEACEAPSGYLESTGEWDCDDDDAEVSPLATEVCDDIDNDCDGLIDDDDLLDSDGGVDVSTGETYYLDSDGDGYGDATMSTEACEAPSGYVADATDCDDSSSSVYPGAPEYCDGVDSDCDGTDDDPDATDASTFYADDDGDGYGDATATTTGCDTPSGYVTDDTDCDDTDADVSPAGTEVCNEIDDDCDGSIDDDDSDVSYASDETWYADADGDGYGDADTSLSACDTPSGYTVDDTDCDDTDADVSPGATETWYDGTDADCDGASDYDADGDGDDSDDWGGGDCDDTDPDRYTDNGCRPALDCTPPSLSTIEGADPSGATDLVFTEDCAVYVCSIISGTDYTYLIESDGTATSISGYSNFNQQSIALAPDESAIALSHNDNSRMGVGFWTGSGSVSDTVRGTYNNGSLWSNSFMNRSSGSLAWDEDGCVWAPGFSGSGSLTCIEEDGTTTDVFTGEDHVETVALDSDDTLYASQGDSIYAVDKSSGAMTLYATVDDDVLDMVFDYNDDLYVEANDGTITLVPADGSAASSFATVSDQGKLAISPDGRLVRIIPAPVSAASYEEWELDD